MSKLIQTALEESLSKLGNIDIFQIKRELTRVRDFLHSKVFVNDSKATVQDFGLALKVIDDLFPELEAMKQDVNKSITWQTAVIDELKSNKGEQS